LDSFSTEKSEGYGFRIRQTKTNAIDFWLWGMLRVKYIVIILALKTIVKKEAFGM
jgi:hypothetical protein